MRILTINVHQGKILFRITLSRIDLALFTKLVAVIVRQSTTRVEADVSQNDIHITPIDIAARKIWWNSLPNPYT